MKNFARALRLSLRHRMTFAASLGCALMVAILWGGNITVVYPFVEVVFRGQSMPQWVDEQINENEQLLSGLQHRLDGLVASAATAGVDEASTVQLQIEQVKGRMAAEQRALDRNRFLRPYLHRYMPVDPFQTLVLMIVAVLTCTLVKEAFLVASTILVARLSELATFDLRIEFYRQVLHADLVGMGQNARGDVMNRFTADMTSVGQGLQTLFGRAIREPLKMVACLIGAALISWRLLLLSMFVAPLAIWLMNRLSRSLKRANRRAMEEMSQIYNSLSETLSGIKVVKAFTMERYELGRFRQTAKMYYRKAMRIAGYNSLISPLTELMGMSIISLAILAGAYLAINQETHLAGIKMSDRPLELGALLLFYSLLAGTSDPARKLSDVFGRLQQGAAAADRIYQILDREAKITDPEPWQPLPRHHRELVIEGVQFGYTPDHKVLENVDLHVRFGETIAIVGPNGCGKSTLANLIPRFFDPDQGSVRIDGVDVRGARLRELRSQIGLVSQETLLFDDTVYNNIRYGAPTAKRDRVMAAARQAHAHRFIEEKLPDGYETVVGPGGNRLSGGQRQRVALARAILRDPAILILDEATSQIDLESEQLIHQVLQKFIHNRTTIIITHRLSTLALADRIVVMDHGRILDVGTHAELMARCDFYRRMNQMGLQQTA